MTQDKIWQDSPGKAFLKSLRMMNFKNHSDTSIEFGQNISVFYGLNGSGKTSILEAIYYLCVGRSFHIIQDHVYVNTLSYDGFRLFANFLLDAIPFQVECIFKPGTGKKISVNGKECDRISDHIGRLPVIAFYPADISLVWGFSSERRRFFDQILSSVNPTYLKTLKKYHNILDQRNSLLRQAKNYSKALDFMLLDIYNNELAQCSEVIRNYRVELINFLSGSLKYHYQKLVDDHENPSLFFDSDVTLDESFLETYRKSFELDLRTGATNRGIHKDDYIFHLKNNLLKKTGSQGQQKTFLVALKLGISEFITQKTAKTPLILLDDIFDKLDYKRVESLMSILMNFHSQVFITDTYSDRISKMLHKSNQSFDIFECDNGKVHYLAYTN